MRATFLTPARAALLLAAVPACLKKTYLTMVRASAITNNRCACLFDKKRNQCQSRDAVEPPPAEQSRRCQAND